MSASDVWEAVSSLFIVVGLGIKAAAGIAFTVIVKNLVEDWLDRDKDKPEAPL